MDTAWSCHLPWPIPKWNPVRNHVECITDVFPARIGFTSSIHPTGRGNSLPSTCNKNFVLGLSSLRGLLGGIDGKASACNVGELGSITGLGRSPGEGNGNPLQYSCLENSLERSLVGYSSRGHKESDMTEQLHFHF